MNTSSDRQLPCAIARCRRLGSLWIGHEGYLCEFHATNIWSRVEKRDTDLCDEPVPGSEGREYERADFRAKHTRGKRKPSAMGQVYFVLVDGVVKVGWTSKLADRVRAYGPKATLLANYPGTRTDEANLHRQLTPARFRGREWYHDCPIVRDFIAASLEHLGSINRSARAARLREARTFRPSCRSPGRSRHGGIGRTP